MDTWTWVRTREDAAFAYEEAKRRLTQSLHAQAARLAEREREREEAEAREARRAKLIEQMAVYFGPLTRYVQLEIAQREQEESIPAGVISADDVVSATFATAINLVDHAPSGPGLYRWLRELARVEILEKADLLTRAGTPAPPAPSQPPTAPAEEPQLERLLDHLNAQQVALPEDLLEHEATRRLLMRTLARLPERWREIFLLSVIDHWEAQEIAQAESIEESEVMPIVDASRRIVREWLREHAQLPAPASQGAR
jgi:DNA-directed RNA polymerase specialized sigma24 family protein